ncbi:MAG TPA: MerR family transcriptional regulator [Methylomirabilota bacterium]|jgi:DNA-binding transcriptional MerR regulator|nr:MerR family transcriptional regulator [Methylomirabilota bacterium]
MGLTIGVIAKTTGVAAKTIRYYEQVGVLPLPGRTASGYRQYTEQGIQQVRFVRRARALGLSLDQLKALTVALDGGSRTAMRPRLLRLVAQHLSTVRRRIRELGSLERQLAQARRRLAEPSRRGPDGGCRCLDPVDSGRARRTGRAARRALPRRRSPRGR